MSYQTYIFDLDGTLIDSMGMWHEIDVEYLMRFGIDAPEDLQKELEGLTYTDVARYFKDRFHIPDSIDEIGDAWIRMAVDTTRPYKGIPEMLQELKRRGKHTAVVSNKFDAATKELCRHFFPDTIDVAVGEHEAEGIRKKPAPDTVLQALSQLGVGQEGAVYVGDSDVDIQTARNSGLPCISVLWGFRDREFLLAHGAETFVSQPSELLL